MKRVTVAMIVAVGLVLAGWGAGVAPVCGAAEIKTAEARQGIRIVELRGDPKELGTGHGQALGEQMKLLHEKYLKAWFRDDAIRKRALTAAFLFRNFLPGDYRNELGAMAQASGLDPGEAMLANCFLDLMPATACSTITVPAEASLDGVGRFGRNLDFPSLNIADQYSVLMIVHPKDRYAFAAVTWPGLIGVLSGMNEHGLALANMEVARGAVMPQAMPYTLLYRLVLEKCKTVDEAVELIRNTPRQSANNLMLMDASGDRAVVEIRPEGVTVRKADAKTALISTNHQRGEDQATAGMCRRYDSLRKVSVQQFGRIDAAAIERMLDGVAAGKATLQSMVFEPSSRVIYLAVGAEATKREYQKIDLKAYFSAGQGSSASLPR